MKFKRICYCLVEDEMEIDIEKEWPEFYQYCKNCGYDEEIIMEEKAQGLNHSEIFQDFLSAKYSERKVESNAKIYFIDDFSFADCWDNEYEFED